MITEVLPGREGELAAFLSAHSHPQLLKIACRYRAYGLQYDFCRFYLCGERGAASAAAVLSGGCALVYTTEKNLPELEQWLAMLPLQSVSVNAAGRSILENPRTGSIFYCVPAGRKSPPPEGTLDGAFAILREAFGEEQYSEGRYSSWYCEMSHNIRHGVSRLYAAENATATALCIGEEQVVLNQVAVLPSGQGKGIGRGLVQRVAGQFPGRRVFVYSRNAGTDQFYRKAGFSYFEDWFEI